MALKWDLYKTRLEITGTTFKERQINDVIDAINDNFEDSPSFYEVSINGSSTLTGVQIVDNSSNDANKVDYIRKIVMKPNDTITVGDIVDWDSKKWIITSAEKFSDVYYYGMMQECNNTLKFYDKNSVSFKLCSIPCIFSRQRLSTDENNYMTLQSGHYLVTIPSGYITKSDVDLRFILNDSAYKVSSIDNSTNSLVYIDVVDDVFVPDDNRTLGIANYYSHQIMQEVVILNGTSIKKYVGDEPFQLNIQCTQNGTIVENPTVTYESEDELVCIVSPTGIVTLVGTGITNVIVHFGIATDSISIQSEMIAENNYNVVLTPSDTEIKANRSLTFNAKVTNNGVDDLIKEVGFDVTNVDGSNNQYVTYSINGNSITINAGSTYNKVVDIKAYMKFNTTIYETRQLSIISLL